MPSSQEIDQALRYAGGRAWKLAARAGAPDAEAVVAAARYGVAEAIATWDPARATFATYAFNCSHNRACKEVREQLRYGIMWGPKGLERPLSLDWPISGEGDTFLDEAPDPRPGPEDLALQMEAWEALRTMRPKQREAAVLHFAAGLDRAEVAVRQGVTRDCVQLRIWRGCRRAQKAAR